jgi:hypothetical protein
MFCISCKTVFAGIAALAGLIATTSQAHAQFLIDDPFDVLSSTWTIQRGSASIADGWLRLQGIPGIPRDAFVMAGEGASWTDYRLVTKFHSDGGGDNWFNALINFRVQKLTGWSEGTYYGFYFYPPNSAIPPSGSFALVKKTDSGYSELPPLFYDASSLLVGDNLVDIEVSGRNIDLLLNGHLAGRYYDPDPIPSGGVALGAIWESVTRYDFVQVIEPYILVPSRESQSPKQAGAAASLRFKTIDSQGINRSSLKIPVAVQQLRHVETGETKQALAPGTKPRPAEARYEGQAYQVQLNTTGLKPGQWHLEVSVNRDPRPQRVPFTIKDKKK